MIGANTDGGTAAKGTQPALATDASNPAFLPLAAMDPGERAAWDSATYRFLVKLGWAQPAGITSGADRSRCPRRPARSSPRPSAAR
jgi:hypothetical protein